MKLAERSLSGAARQVQDSSSSGGERCCSSPVTVPVLVTDGSSSSLLVDPSREVRISLNLSPL